LPVVNQDCADWGGDRRLLGEVAGEFRVAELANWALACFIAIPDGERATGLLAEHPRALFAAMEYTREKDGEVAAFLRGLGIGL
jgi:hypothetical protein